MGLFSKLSGADRRAKEALPPEIVIGHGKINAITRNKKFGYIREAAGVENVFFKSTAVEDFDSLQIGQAVEYTREIDPGDPMRVHAVNVHLV